MDKINNEIWKPVMGYNGLYEVSSLGRVKSLNYKRTGREQILKAGKNKKGYLYVILSKSGVRTKYFVHRLVAEAFIPNPDPEKYDIVNHKIEGDEGKLINTVENLEWCDIPYNNAYGTRNERIAKANTNGKCSKTVYQYDKDTHELVKEWQSTNEVERQMGWSCSHITECCNGKIKSAYNFIWSYTLL